MECCPEGEQRGRVRRASGGGGPEFTASGVTREAFQPEDLAFSQISAPRARPSPPVFTLRKHSSWQTPGASHSSSTAEPVAARSARLGGDRSGGGGWVGAGQPRRAGVGSGKPGNPVQRTPTAGFAGLGAAPRTRAPRRRRPEGGEGDGGGGAGGVVQGAGGRGPGVRLQAGGQPAEPAGVRPPGAPQGGRVALRRRAPPALGRVPPRVRSRGRPFLLPLRTGSGGGARPPEAQSPRQRARGRWVGHPHSPPTCAREMPRPASD